MQIGSKVIAIWMSHLGVGIVVDITKTGLLRVVFDDNFCDNFAALELELATEYAKTA